MCAELLAIGVADLAVPACVVVQNLTPLRWWWWSVTAKTRTRWTAAGAATATTAWWPSTAASIWTPAPSASVLLKAATSQRISLRQEKEVDLLSFTWERGKSSTGSRNCFYVVGFCEVLLSLSWAKGLKCHLSLFNINILWCKSRNLLIFNSLVAGMMGGCRWNSQGPVVHGLILWIMGLLGAYSLSTFHCKKLLLFTQK